MATLPPWLDIRPQHFTEAAIAGGQLGQKLSQEAAELAQRGIAQASEIANRAEALQVQRESIAAELAGRQAAAAQRAQEAAGELALAQQQFGLEKQAQQEAAARIGQQDAVMQEAQSRYQRAINSGDDPAAADLEILQPLRDVTGGGRKSAASSPNQWSGPMNLGNGEVVQVNKLTGETRTAREANPTADKTQESSAKAAALVSNKKLTSDLKAVDSEIAAQNKLLRGETNDDEKNKILGRLLSLDRKRRALFQPSGAIAPPNTTTAPPQQMLVPPSEIPTGAPKSSAQIFDPPAQQLRPGFGIPEMAVSPAAPQNFPTATNKKTGAKVIFRDGKWQPAS